MDYLISENGEEKRITAQQATHLASLLLIYPCPECSQGREVYHIFGGCSDPEHAWQKVNSVLNQTP